METSLIRHSKAIAARAANSTAFRFSTGKAPGSPRHTGHTFVFGGSPKRVEHEQKIFDAVRSCTWTSSPMTGSYFASKPSEMAGVVAISAHYVLRSTPPLTSLRGSGIGSVFGLSFREGCESRRARSSVVEGSSLLRSLVFSCAFMPTRETG